MTAVEQEEVMSKKKEDREQKEYASILQQLMHYCILYIAYKDYT